MANPLILTAPCKINLYLDITGVRPDGYHELNTVFYPLYNPYDRIEIRAGDKGSGLEFSCSMAELDGADNLMVKAYRLFTERTGFFPDLKVMLYKNIPAGAGLGGGSSDAAVFLSYLNALNKSYSLPEADLKQVALWLGADVPFFLNPHPAYAEGLGEKLRNIRLSLVDFHILVVMPTIRVSTAWAYKEYDSAAGGHAQAHNCKEFFLKLLTIAVAEDNRPSSVTHIPLYNSFERIVFRRFTEIGRIKRELYRLGASGALMSGSGSALFALFRSGRDAESAAERFSGLGMKVFLSNCE